MPPPGNPVVIEAPVEKLQRLAVLKAQVRERLARKFNGKWHQTARPEQLPPDGKWRYWLACAGRGWGKTRACAEWAAKMARKYPGCRIALVAATFQDGRDTMVEGESGLLAVLDDAELRGGNRDAAWNRSLGELWLDNGSHFKIFSSERPARLRGPQHHFAWGDEPAYWLDAHKGTAKDTTFSNLNFGLRLPADPSWTRDDQLDYRPQAVFATTPRRVALMKIPDQQLADQPKNAGLLQMKSVIIVRGRTDDNLANLSKEYREEVIDPLRGTTLGRQELDGDLLEDAEGALWTQAVLDADRVEVAPGPLREVLAFDPAGGDGQGHDEHGIVHVGARGTRGTAQFYVLADLSKRGTPTQAVRRSLLYADEHSIGTIVFEKNQGQDWIPTVFKATYDSMRADGEVSGLMPRLIDVSATKSKRARAQPVVGLYEQHRVHHVGPLPELEYQQTSWVPDEGDSPDRIDALVWGVNHLNATAAGPSSIGRGRQAPRLPAVALAGPR